jgi:predicted dehydrogenase
MSFLSRREFLRDSSLFAAAAAALGPSAATADEVRPAKKVGANDRIHVACIGFHGQGGTHLGKFSTLPDTVITHICDVDSNLANNGIKKVEAGQKQAPQFVQDLRKIMEDKSINVVSIATPNHWHALAAIWAIQAGKDVYVEKPVSHNVWEGRRIVDFARQQGRIVQTGTQSRSNQGMREALDYIHSGKIGKVTLARGLCWKDGNRHFKGRGLGPATNTPIPKGVDYDLWLGPAPEKPLTRERLHYDWHWFWDYGNGDLGNQGIHEMDKCRWGLNKSTLCNAVFSLGGRFLWNDCGETPNSQVCYFDYGDCALVFEVRNMPSKPLLGVGVGNIWYGTDGYVVSTNYNSGVVFTPQGEQVKKFDGGGDHYANFIKAVKSRKHTDLNADIEDGHLSSALCHLGNISYRLGSVQKYSPGTKLDIDKDTDEALVRMLEYVKANNVSLDGLPLQVGKRLKFDPRTERFIGNEEANRLLTRDYRKGFEVPAKG